MGEDTKVLMEAGDRFWTKDEDYSMEWRVLPSGRVAPVRKVRIEKQEEQT